MGGGMPPGGGMGNTENGKKVMQRIASETGGRFFEVSKRMPIDKVYEAIQEDLRSQYSIGYTPEGAPNSSEYRRIHLTTKQRALVVQTREGYYPS
jgi:VWFA-related protein